MKVSKSLGQVFLQDKYYIQKLIKHSEIKNENVLEIGAGDGRLSSLLAEKAKLLYCVELDTRFVNLLTETLKDYPQVKIICSDILKVNLNQIEHPLVIFGNIPYQLSNRLIVYIVENKAYITKAYLTLQKEFAQKLLAKAGEPQYGFLSCFIQYYATVTKLFDIPRGAFVPIPKVDSTFVKIEFSIQAKYGKVNEEVLFRLIRKAFSQRRKKLINMLPFLKDKASFLSSIGLKADVRAENVSLEQYIDISRYYVS
jgi:16S rRNA (adenine1518-N6/adenine1519-N6)-dimethyltransferase